MKGYGSISLFSLYTKTYNFRTNPAWVSLFPERCHICPSFPWKWSHSGGYRSVGLFLSGCIVPCFQGLQRSNIDLILVRIWPLGAWWSRPCKYLSRQAAIPKAAQVTWIMWSGNFPQFGPFISSSAPCCLPFNTWDNTSLDSNASPKSFLLPNSQALAYRPTALGT